MIAYGEYGQMSIGALFKKTTHLARSLFNAKAAILGAGVAVFAMTTSPTAYAGAKGVIELYTSQGCSSCPPADALAYEYSKNPDFVVLTLPVTYWDYLGWKDTYAKKSFTNRQYAYAALRGDRSVYTPQVVINGYDHTVGSDKAQIDKLLAEKPLPVKIKIKSNGDELLIKIDEREDAKEATLWLALFKREGTVEIGRGENRDRTITYTNIVREMRPFVNWYGKAIEVNLPKEEVMGEAYDGMAIILQTKVKGNPSYILGAAAWIDG